MRSILLLLVLLPCICWTQSSSGGSSAETRGCQCSEQDGAVVRLSQNEMRSHVAHVEPLKVHETHVTLNGSLVLRVRFESDGTVTCVKAISGNPLAIASATEVLPKWTFRPVEKKNGKHGGCGLVKVRYRLSDSEQKTTVE